MKSRLQQSFEYYLAHQAELVQAYNGKYVVIIGDRVVGSYGSEAEAIAETLKSHDLGTFLVQRVEPGDASYTQSFHSRVSFA
jgi:hypothetical protein